MYTYIKGFLKVFEIENLIVYVSRYAFYKNVYILSTTLKKII